MGVEGLVRHVRIFWRSLFYVQVDSFLILPFLSPPHSKGTCHVQIHPNPRHSQLIKLKSCSAYNEKQKPISKSWIIPLPPYNHHYFTCFPLGWAWPNSISHLDRTRVSRSKTRPSLSPYLSKEGTYKCYISYFVGRAYTFSRHTSVHLVLISPHPSHIQAGSGKTKTEICIIGKSGSKLQLHHHQHHVSTVWSAWNTVKNRATMKSIEKDWQWLTFCRRAPPQPLRLWCEWCGTLLVFTGRE